MRTCQLGRLDVARLEADIVFRFRGDTGRCSLCCKSAGGHAACRSCKNVDLLRCSQAERSFDRSQPELRCQEVKVHTAKLNLSRQHLPRHRFAVPSFPPPEVFMSSLLAMARSYLIVTGWDFMT